MPKYSVNKDTPLPVAAWLLQDDYVPDEDPNAISVTTIIKNIRPLMLSFHVEDEDKVIELQNQYSSRVGSVIHKALEDIMQNPETVAQGAEALGYSPVLVEKFRNGEVPIHIEERVSKEIAGYKISGQYDLILDGVMHDYKTMTSFSYSKRNTDKLVKQLSINAWLNPDLVTDFIGVIIYLITDFKKFESSRENFPQSRTFSEPFSLMSDAQVEDFLSERLAMVDMYKDMPLEELNEALPYCTDEDLNMSPPVYKYYANPEKLDRATKNFTQYYEADEHLKAKGKGVVIEVKDKISECNFCAARPVCKQAAELELGGLLYEG